MYLTNFAKSDRLRFTRQLSVASVKKEKWKLPAWWMKSCSCY